MQHERFTTASDRAIAQKAAEYLWACAISENQMISRYDSPTYRAAERNFLTAVREVYGLGQRRAERVRNLLAEYGPNDSLQGTTGIGVYSYVSWVMTNRPGKYDS